MAVGEYEGRRPWGRALSPPPHPQEELGFWYPPPEPWEAIHSNRSSLGTGRSNSPSAIDNAIATKWHEGRKYDKTLGFETMRTGMFRPAPGVASPLGGKMEFTNVHVTRSFVEAAKEQMNAALRVVARKFYNEPTKIAAERQRLEDEYADKIGNYRKPMPQLRSKLFADEEAAAAEKNRLAKERAAAAIAARQAQREYLDVSDSPGQLFGMPLSQKEKNSLKKADKGTLPAKLTALAKKHQFRIRDFFNAMDVNKDALISRDEFKDALSHMGVRITLSEVDALFSEMDEDDNGTIDFSELHWMLKEH